MRGGGREWVVVDRDPTSNESFVGDFNEIFWGFAPKNLKYCWQVLPVCYLPCPPYRTGPTYATGPRSARVNALGRAFPLRAAFYSF